VCAFCFQEESNSWDAAAAFINARARGEKARIEIKDNTTGFPPDLYGIRRSRLYAYGVNALAHFYIHIEISFAYVPGDANYFPSISLCLYLWAGRKLNLSLRMHLSSARLQLAAFYENAIPSNPLRVEHKNT
jgi:hypothetical protein